MLPAVQELTCFKVFFLSKAFMTLGGGISSHLGKALISTMWSKYLSFTAQLSSTEGMNKPVTADRPPWPEWLRG